MSLRTIMIFPDFDNMEVINPIREKYDPLANLVNPHITIPFPFEGKISNKELSHILDKRLYRIKPFEIELQGISKCKDRFGNYLFLNIIKGKETIVEIHNNLYRNEFKTFNLGLDYLPYITVGSLTNSQELDKAYETVKNIDCKFVSIVNKISVEIIGANEESIIIIEKQLQSYEKPFSSNIYDNPSKYISPLLILICDIVSIIINLSNPFCILYLIFYDTPSKNNI